ncbi:TIGR00725 family protein [Chloroflexota bacterium]
MPQENRKFIAVIGGSQCSPEEARTAEEVGREIARCGISLICGGMGGVMEAACRGAAAEGGLTIGILPGDIRQMANPYVRIPVVTGIGHGRNMMVAKSAHAVIAIGGSYGTLSEIAFALLSNIPVIGLNTWKLSKNDIDDTSIIIAKNAKEAVNIASKMVNQ